MNRRARWRVLQGVPFPDNALEVVLLDVWHGEVPPGALVDALGEHPVWVPLEAGELPRLILDGEPYLVVFTSVRQVGAGGAGDLRQIRLTGRQLSARTAAGVGFAVNPGCQVGLPVPASAVDRLRGPEPGIGLRIPSPEPRELQNALVAEFQRRPAIVEARIVLRAGRDGPDSLVVGIRPDRSVPSWGRHARDAVDLATRRLPLAYTVDGLFLDEPGTTADWMIRKAESFYLRW